MALTPALLKASLRSWTSSNLHREGPYWLHWLWTVLFAAVIAVGFTVLGFLMFARDSAGAWRNLAGWAEWYGRNFIVSLTICVTIHLLFDTVSRLLGGGAAIKRWRPWQRTLFFSGLPLLGLAFAWPLGVWLAGGNLFQWARSSQGANTLFGALAVGLGLTLLFHLLFGAKAQQFEAEKRATEAQLKLLQGQMEPHFLFNTLANVSALMEHDVAKARQMLEAFTDYLRSSLTHLRRDEGPLAEELALTEAYLVLLKGRMEDRLSYRIEATEEARRAALPPLLLQPLVENAIHHGLEPQVGGGQVLVHAVVKGQRLELEVRDNGAGPDAPARRRIAGAAAGTGVGNTAGNGVALANLRERLYSRYGSAASLEVSALHPGTLARLVLPLEAS